MGTNEVFLPWIELSLDSSLDYLINHFTVFEVEQTFISQDSLKYFGLNLQGSWFRWWRKEQGSLESDTKVWFFSSTERFSVDPTLTEPVCPRYRWTSCPLLYTKLHRDVPLGKNFSHRSNINGCCAASNRAPLIRPLLNEPRVLAANHLTHIPPADGWFRLIDWF